MTKILALSFNDEQHALLAELMAGSHATNKTAFMVQLLAAEKDRRKKPAIGRPPKDKDSDLEDEPRTIPNPNPMDAKKRPFLTQTEYDGYMQLRGEGN